MDFWIDYQGVSFFSFSWEKKLLIEAYLKLNAERSNQPVNNNHRNLSKLIFKIIIEISSPLLQLRKFLIIKFLNFLIENHIIIGNSNELRHTYILFINHSLKFSDKHTKWPLD